MPSQFGSTFTLDSVPTGTVDLGNNPNTIVEVYAQLKTAPAPGHQHSAITIGGVGLVPEGSANLEFNHLHIDRWVLNNAGLTGVQNLVITGAVNNWLFVVKVWHDAVDVRHFGSNFGPVNGSGDSLGENSEFISLTAPVVQPGDLVVLHSITKQNSTQDFIGYSNGLVESYNAVVGGAGQQMRVSSAEVGITTEAFADSFVAETTSAHIQKGGYLTVITGDTPPVLVDPGPQTATPGVVKTLQLVATDDNPGLVYAFEYTPPGASIDANTGLFTVTFPDEGVFDIEFFAVDSLGQETSLIVQFLVMTAQEQFTLSESNPWAANWELTYVVSNLTPTMLINVDTGDQLVIVGGVVPVSTNDFLAGGQLENTRPGVSYGWRLNDGTTESGLFTFNLAAPANGFSQKVVAASLADIVATYTQFDGLTFAQIVALPQDQWPDALAFDVYASSGFEVEAGDLMLTEGGSVNNLTTPTGLVDPTTRAIRFYSFATNSWSSRIENNYPPLANTPPVLSAIGAQSVAEQQLITIPLSATDVEGTVSFSMTGAPGGAVLTDNGDGTGSITYTSGSGFQGAVSNITVTVTDQSGLTDTEIFPLEILAPGFDMFSGLFGDVIDLFPSGPVDPYVLPAPWIGDTGEWEHTGTCFKPSPTLNPLAARFAQRQTPRLTADVIFAEVLLESISPNDDISPTLTQLDGAGYTVTYARDIAGFVLPTEVDKLDIQRFDSLGALTGIDTITLPQAIQLPARIRLQASKINSVITVFVDQLAVLSQFDATYAPAIGGLYARALNTNNTCIAEFAMQGVTALVIVSLNSTVAASDLVDTGTATIEWSDLKNSPTYDAVDDRGNIEAQVAIAVSTTQDSIAVLDLANLRHGANLVMRADTLEERPFNYPAPVGSRFVNLDAVGPLHLTATTAAWALDSQLRYSALTDQGNAVTISDRGVITAAGDFWQSLDVAEHAAGVYGTAVKEYIFEDIRNGPIPIPALLVSDSVTSSINLALHFNSTVTLPTGPLGSSGSGLQVAATGLAGLTISGLGTAAPMLNVNTNAVPGTYPVTVTVTDPAGNSLPLVVNVTVGAAVSAPVVVSAAVTVVLPTTIVSQINANSNSGSGQITVYVIAVPLGTDQAVSSQIAAGQNIFGSPVPSAGVTGSNGTVSPAITGLADGSTYEIQYAIVGSAGLATIGQIDNGGLGYTTPSFAVGDTNRSKQSGIMTQRQSKPSNLKPNLGKGTK